MTAIGVKENWSDLVGVGANAIADTMRPLDAYVQWPLATIAGVTGGMAPGTVWFIAGRSQGGKTVVTRHCVASWMQAMPVGVFSLETTREAYVTEMAAVNVGVFPGDVVGGKIPPNDPRMVQVRAEIERLTIPRDMAERLVLSPLDELEENAFTAEVERMVEDVGVRLILVDHIDHGAAGSRVPEWQQSAAMAQAGLRLAKQYGIVVVFTTQLNGSIYAASHSDRLAKYGPPQEQHIRNGQVKRQVATGMLGLFRPLRNPRPYETADEYRVAIRAARAGETDPASVLDPACMGIVAMKLRNAGHLEGTRVYVRFENGALSDYALEADRYAR